MKNLVERLTTYASLAVSVLRRVLDLLVSLTEIVRGIVQRIEELLAKYGK